MNAIITITYFLAAYSAGALLNRRKFVFALSSIVGCVVALFFLTSALAQTITIVAPKSDPGVVAIFGAILVGMVGAIIDNVLSTQRWAKPPPQ